MMRSHCSFPVVNVPVLSVKRIFIEPAVSIPTSFLTRTPSRSIFRIFADKTTVIIIGSPSGAATTTTVIIKVSAWIKVEQTKEISFIESEILEQFIPEAPKEEDVIAYLESRWPISRSKMDFPMYQNACVEHFGQKVEPAIIFKFIRNDY